MFFLTENEAMHCGTCSHSRENQSGEKMFCLMKQTASLLDFILL